MNIITTQISNGLFAFNDLQFSSDLNFASSRPLKRRSFSYQTNNTEWEVEAHPWNLFERYRAVFYLFRSNSIYSMKIRGMTDLLGVFTFCLLAHPRHQIPTGLQMAFSSNFGFYHFHETWWKTSYSISKFRFSIVRIRFKWKVHFPETTQNLCSEFKAFEIVNAIICIATIFQGSNVV